MPNIRLVISPNIVAHPFSVTTEIAKKVDIYLKHIHFGISAAVGDELIVITSFKVRQSGAQSNIRTEDTQKLDISCALRNSAKNCN